MQHLPMTLQTNACGRRLVVAAEELPACCALMPLPAAKPASALWLSGGMKEYDSWPTAP